MNQCRRQDFLIWGYNPGGLEDGSPQWRPGAKNR